MKNKSNPVVENSVDAEIEAMLEGLDGDSVQNAPAPQAMHAETIEIESDDVALLEEVVAEITSDNLKTTSYNAQPAPPVEIESTGASTDAPAVSKKRGRKPGVVAAIKPPKTPRAPSIVGMKPSEALKQTLPESELLKVAMIGLPNTEDVDAFLGRIDTLAKKVGQKAVNFLRFADKPERLEGYIEHGLKALLAHPDKRITCGELYHALRTIGYTDGTARSQSSQLNILFPALGVTIKNGRDLEVNPDSTLLNRYIAATSTATPITV